MTQAYLLYDDGCGVCAATKDLVQRFDTDQSIESMGLTSERARALASDLEEAAYWGTFHLVRQGHVRSGADAFEDLLGILPATRPFRKAIQELPPIRSGARSLFEFAVRLRGDLQCDHAQGKRRAPSPGARAP